MFVELNWIVIQCVLECPAELYNLLYSNQEKSDESGIWAQIIKVLHMS